MFQRQLTFGEAVQRALTVNYCNFSGRASLSEFWWYILFEVILNFISGFFYKLSPISYEVINVIIFLALLLPSLGLSVRRLHDINRSGWWIFLWLIPVVGWIILLIWYLKPSQPVPNEYGPVPNLIER